MTVEIKDTAEIFYFNNVTTVSLFGLSLKWKHFVIFSTGSNLNEIWSVRTSSCNVLVPLDLHANRVDSDPYSLDAGKF